MKNKLIERMKLNCSKEVNKDFNKSIKFVVEEFIENDIPKQHIFNNLNDMIIKAYSLFLSKNLKGTCLIDRIGNNSYTDALNYFTDDFNKLEKDIEIKQLKLELELYKEFIIKNNATNSFQEYKKHLKTTTLK